MPRGSLFREVGIALLLTYAPLVAAGAQGLPRPIPPSGISDQERRLTDAERAQLERRLEGLRRDGIGEIFVAIVGRIGDRPAPETAADLYRAWGLRGERGSTEGRPQALLLISTDSTADGLNPTYWVEAGDEEAMTRIENLANRGFRSGIMFNLNRGQVARAIADGIGTVEARLRTHTGVGLTPAPAASPRVAPSVGWGWILGSAAGFGALALLVVAVRSRAQAAQRTCPKCARTMEVASEIRRARLLDEAQLKEERAGGARYLVLACRCGQTQVKSTS